MCKRLRYEFCGELFCPFWVKNFLHGPVAVESEKSEIEQLSNAVDRAVKETANKDWPKGNPTPDHWAEIHDANERYKAR